MSPLLPVLVVAVASLVSILLSRRTIPLRRSALAIAVAAAIEYGSVFVISGFGWGWVDPSRYSLMLGRLAVGLGIGVSCMAFAWLASAKRLRLLTLLLLLLPIVIMLPEYSYDGPWALLVVFLVITYADFKHLKN